MFAKRNIRGNLMIELALVMMFVVIIGVVFVQSGEEIGDAIHAGLQSNGSRIVSLTDITKGTK